MCQFSSKGFFYLVFTIALLLGRAGWAEYVPYKTASIDRFIDYQKITALSDRDDWEIGEILPIISQNANLGVIGFVELNSVIPVGFKKFELRLKLLRQSRKYFIQTGDTVRRMDLGIHNEDYTGSTELLIHQSQMNVSSRYRPLFYQGVAIGETAQTLFEKEFLVTYLGSLSYGVKDWFTIGSVLPANLLGAPNANFKARVWDTESTTLSTGLAFTRLVKDDESTLNLNLYWDSISSGSLITHTFLSLGLVKWKGAADASAIKALGSSSFQTGYEVILSNWDRFLIGPSYNFEKKALGGYLSYVWVYDRFHFQLSANATDITHLRASATDGYYGFFDLYWRF
ncbi:MAG: hypothetical protein H7256_07465 [Bdellovibrio sp.]|nr:hypothetical protein [Bdellovibrio sp.]